MTTVIIVIICLVIVAAAITDRVMRWLRPASPKYPRRAVLINGGKPGGVGVTRPEVPRPVLRKVGEQ